MGGQRDRAGWECICVPLDGAVDAQQVVREHWAEGWLWVPTSGRQHVELVFERPLPARSLPRDGRNPFSD